MTNQLGKFIHQKRLEKNLSLREFAKLCEISHTHLDSIEKGMDYRTGKPVNITNETLSKLASALGVSPQQLLSMSLNQFSDFSHTGTVVGFGAKGQDIIEVSPEEYQMIKDFLYAHRRRGNTEGK